ncbi:leucine-rich single-pass membrane protein 2 [Varanus komodoensis]|uniref:leucine-rich single-pass membrane protein 2 n=1 Tax=Varanus komodoensis TaxID=61221 RepID=UPI001CF796F7|nr:leucine-rich single-pass membrane protein 2 [Varanus komodoensis]
MSSEIAEGAMVKEATSSDRELVEPCDTDRAEINLHAVESISDLHYASGRPEGFKASEGSSQSQPNTPWTPHSASSKHFFFPNEEDPSFLPVQNLHIAPDFFCCPCFSPTCCPTGFFALLGVLVVASLGLATLAVYLSVLQRESLRVLSQWLESQEEAIRQMRAVSVQLWRQLNASEPGAQT